MTERNTRPDPRWDRRPTDARLLEILRAAALADQDSGLLGGSASLDTSALIARLNRPRASVLGGLRRLRAAGQIRAIPSSGCRRAIRWQLAERHAQGADRVPQGSPR